jgi:hypothetical protein
MSTCPWACGSVTRARPSAAAGDLLVRFPASSLCRLLRFHRVQLTAMAAIRPLLPRLGYFRLYRTLNPEEEVSTVGVPVRIQVHWARLAHLVRG